MNCSHLCMYCVILVTTGQNKTRRTVVGRSHLVRSPCFIPQTTFYTQSAMPSPRLMPQSEFYNKSVGCIPQLSAICSPQSTVQTFMFYTDRKPTILDRVIDVIDQ